jgi:hypothetical protein
MSACYAVCVTAASFIRVYHRGALRRHSMTWSPNQTEEERTTHSYAVLVVSQSTYDEILAKLTAAGYHTDAPKSTNHGNVIDMHGLALAPPPVVPRARPTVGGKCTVPECVFGVDSVFPVDAVVVSVEPEGRCVVRARGDNLDVNDGEITMVAS